MNKVVTSKRLETIGLVVLVTICVLGVGSTMVLGQQNDTIQRYLTNLPFAMPAMTVPQFPDYRVSIVDYGAVSDGHTLNTDAFAKAIEACVSAGGGTIVVPPGTWLTGPIKLESNINLHVERGALVEFSKRFEDYPLIAGYDGKSKKYVLTPPLFAFGATNIAITGEGIFDGSGGAWRPVKKEKQTSRQWKELLASGGAVSPDGKIWWPSKEALDAEQYLKELEKSKKGHTAEDYAKARQYLRPDMVRLVRCNGILLDGPTFRNSPRFHVYPVQSENIIVRNVKIQTDWFAQNGDGLDFGSCRKVLVYNTTVDAGDDAICLKPGKIAAGQKLGPACENIVIADCIVYHGHGGFVIGSESRGGVNNVSVRNCTFIGTDVGLRFKSLREKGGLVQNVYIDGVQMKNIVNEAILFDMYYGEGNPEEQATEGVDNKRIEPVAELTPQFRDISIKNIVCNGANRAVLINGLPEMPVRAIQIVDVSILSKKGILCIDADSILFRNVSIRPESGPVVSLNQSRNISLDGVKFPENAELFLKVDGDKSAGIQLTNIDLSTVKKKVEIGKNAKQSAVVMK
jgi:polygalacturonase